jgi:hypothetical protein
VYQKAMLIVLRERGVEVKPEFPIAVVFHPC